MQLETWTAWGFFMLIHNPAMHQYYSQLPLLNKITTNVIAKSQKKDLLQVSPKFVDRLLIIIVSNNLTIIPYSDIMNFAGAPWDTPIFL